MKNDLQYIKLNNAPKPFELITEKLYESNTDMFADYSACG